MIESEPDTKVRPTGGYSPMRPFLLVLYPTEVRGVRDVFCYSTGRALEAIAAAPPSQPTTKIQSDDA
jgi:hypothetical protein